MDVVVHSFPGGWASIFHCGSSNNIRSPGIWLNKESTGFGFRWDTISQTNVAVNSGSGLVIGETNHLQYDVTQGTLKITLNGEVLLERTDLSQHKTYDNMVCYASDPWYPAADVTISNLIVSDGTATTAKPTKQPTPTPTRSPTLE